MKRAALYCRLSEEDGHKRLETDDSNSIKNQKTMLIQYAMDHEWEVFDIYSDDDYAGADRSRPEFNRLLRDASARRFDIVLCKTQSRFTRELELVEKYIHGLFPVWGVRFVSVVDNADTENRGNKKSRQINGLVNEWYLEDMSENIKSVLISRRQNGYHIGAFALYGYRKDPAEKGRLLIDAEAAAVVREVFCLFAQGYGKTAIARMLNGRGVPNPTEYKRLHGLRYQQPKRKNSTLWKYSAISDMLKNEIYIGNMVQGKYGSVSYKTKRCRPRPKESWYHREGTHAPIVERALWDWVQALIAERSKPFSSGTVGLFAGKARCMGCGYGMRSNKSHGNYYLRCASRHVAAESCEGAFLSVNSLERAVVAELNRLLAAHLDKDRAALEIDLSAGLQAQIEREQKDAAAYEKQIGECETGLRALYLDKLKGVVAEDSFAELSRYFIQEKERLSRSVAEARQRLGALNKEMTEGDGRTDRMEWYAHPDRLTREMVTILIDHIRIGRRDEKTGVVPVEIHWRF